MRSSKKILMIVIIIIVVLAVAGTVVGVLYFKTDLFKSDKELFGKYIMQDVQNIQKISQSNIYQTYKDVKQQNTYESNTNIVINYSEGGEVSNLFNNLGFSFKEQKDNGYSYRNAQILFQEENSSGAEGETQDENYFEIEGVKQDDLYAARLTKEIKQYLSIRNTDEAQYLTNIGINQNLLEQIIQLIENDNLLINQIFTEDEIKTLESEFFNIIKENIEKADFDHQNNVLITIDNNTVKVNSYIATLQPDQVHEMINQLLRNIQSNEIILNKMDKFYINKDKFITEIDDYLENLGIDEQIQPLKITVYAKSKETLRTAIEYGVTTVTIENSYNSNTQTLKIQKNVLNDDEEEEQTIEISKTQENLNENYNIKANIVAGTDQKSFDVNIDMQNNNDNIETTAIIKYVNGITDVKVTFNNNVNMSEITDKIELDETNNIILTDLDDATRQNIFDILVTGIPERISPRMKELIEKIKVQEFIDKIFLIYEDDTPEENNTTVEQPTEGTENSNGEQMSQIEINRFNAKFEFYTGNEVSSDNVKTLLDIVKSHLNSVEISETGEIKLIIEKDKENIEQMNKALEQIEDGAKYKVLITYKDSNGIIDYITINKIEED